MSAGTTLSMNSSSDAALTSWSIVPVTSGLGPMWRATKRSAGSREARAVAMVERLFANLLLVLLAPQEVVEFLRTLDPEPDHPALAVGVPVHEGRVTVERRVDLRDRAGEGGKELRDRLHRLDRPEHVHARERRSDLGQVDVHDVAQLALCIISDPDLDDRRVVGLLDVLVLFGVAQVRRRLRHAGFALARGSPRSRRRLPGHHTPVNPMGWLTGTDRVAVPRRGHQARSVAAGRHPKGASRAARQPGRGHHSGARVSPGADRKSTRLNSSHANISYAVFCLKKKKNKYKQTTLMITQSKEITELKTART